MLIVVDQVDYLRNVLHPPPLRGRQCENDSRAVGLVLVELQGPAMGQGDRAANRQPQPQSLRLGAYKGLERFRPHLGDNPGPRSEIANSRNPSSRWRVAMAIRRSEGAKWDMASVAFKIKLRMTCC